MVRGLRARPFSAAALLLLVTGLGLSAISAQRERAHALTAGDDSLRAVVRVAEALAEADLARIQALLARLRVELRGHESWQKAGGASGESAAARAGTRLNDTMLRRALEGAPDLAAIELVVADGDGLSLTRVEPDGLPGAFTDAEEAQERARSLWYAEEVAEAVAGNGRRMTRGEVVFEPAGESERAVSRVALALQDAGDLVQGALVATVDLGPLGRRLTALATHDIRFALMSERGVGIGVAVKLAPEQVAARLEADGSKGAEDDSVAAADQAPPAADVDAEAHAGASHETTPAASAASTPILEENGIRSLVVKLAGGPEDRAGLVVWVERDAPPSLAAAMLHGASGGSLAAVVLLAVLVVYAEGALRRAGSASEGARARRPRRFGTRSRRADADALDRAPAALVDAACADEETGVRRERFVLREWLADVRGCLEREAASRGLTLDLRCERSLPREIEQDPLWLGGLLISMGREALDATRATRVALEVFGGADHALHFEVDAGDTELAAIPGMRALAETLGASVADEGRGRLAIVVPDALA